MFLYIMNNLKRLLVLLFFSIGLFFIFKTVFLSRHPDFEVYYFATKAFIAEKNIYSFPSSVGTFIYPPFALLLILPFALFPLPLAQILWTSLSILVFFLSLVVLLRSEGEKYFS